MEGCILDLCIDDLLQKKNVETFEGRVGFERDYVIFKFMRVYYLNDYFFSLYFIICILLFV